MAIAGVNLALTNSTGSSTATLSLITGSGTGYTGNSSSAALTSIYATGTAVTGSIGSSIASLQTITATGTGGLLPGILRSMQPFTKSATALLGVSGSMVKTPQLPVKSMGGFSGLPKTLQPFTKSMTGKSGSVASMSKTTEYLTKTMRVDPFGAMVKTMQYATAVKTGLLGGVGSMSKTMQLATTTKAGYVQVTGTMAKTLGLLQKSMSGVQSSGTGYITVSMHTEKQALTVYTNFPFNSFCQFGGKVYGASDAGLFELTGATDNGVAIAAIATGGVSDFGDSHLKVVDRVHVGYRTDGDIAFTITQHDDGQSYAYPLPSFGAPGIFGRRVPFGRGLRARYFQWSVSNVAGSDMEIDAIEFNVRTYGRRIGGSDA